MIKPIHYGLFLLLFILSLVAYDAESHLTNEDEVLSSYSFEQLKNCDQETLKALNITYQLFTPKP